MQVSYVNELSQDSANLQAMAIQSTNRQRQTPMRSLAFISLLLLFAAAALPLALLVPAEL
ncbi:MAG: hypothetical protein AAF704_15440 [Cyanobacteria bacterium P01_D01_bin.123]